MDQNILDFARSLYVPKTKKVAHGELMKFIALHDLHPVSESDAGTIWRKMLIVETKGKGKRETYSTHYVADVDIDSVGKKYAMTYIRIPSGSNKPYRMDITSCKNLLIDFN